MKRPTEAVSAWRARANRLRWWWQRRMGWPVGVALAPIALAAALAFWLRPATEAQRKVLAHQQTARLDSLAQQRARLSAAQPPDVGERLRRDIPSLQRRGEMVAHLLDLMSGAGVTVERAEYAAEDQEPQLSRLKVTLPFTGSYAQTRSAMARLLNELPNAALDSVEIERRSAELMNLEGTLRLSLYFRKDGP